MKNITLVTIMVLDSVMVACGTAPSSGAAAGPGTASGVSSGTTTINVPARVFSRSSVLRDR